MSQHKKSLVLVECIEPCSCKGCALDRDDLTCGNCRYMSIFIENTPEARAQYAVRLVTYRLTGEYRE